MSCSRDRWTQEEEDTSLHSYQSTNYHIPHQAEVAHDHFANPQRHRNVTLITRLVKVWYQMITLTKCPVFRSSLNLNGKFRPTWTQFDIWDLCRFPEWVSSKYNFLLLQVNVRINVKCARKVFEIEASWTDIPDVTPGICHISKFF